MKNRILFFLLLAGTKCFAQNAVGIGTSMPSSRLEVVSAAATSTNASIHATNTGTYGNAILGASNNAGTYGVRGLSNTGIGVQGYTNGGTALVGVSLGGTAIYAQSLGGYGLVSSGNLKISGGNTSPSKGALLSSDANGNVTWKRSGVAFRAFNAANSIGETIAKVEFSSEAYDTQNNFTVYAGAANSGSSVFTAPVAGIYHFTAAIVFEKAGVGQYDNYFQNGYIRLVRNNSFITQNYASSVTHLNSGGTYSCYVYLQVEVDILLNVGDKIFVEARNDQNSATHTPIAIPVNSSAYNSYFTGELIYAD